MSWFGVFRSAPPALQDGQQAQPSIDASGRLIVADAAGGSAASPAFNRSVGSATMATGQVSVATTATQIVAARAGRNAVTITNVTGAQQVYIGNAAVSAATGTLLPATVGASITIPFVGAVFGISITAAQTVSFMETYG